MISVRPAGESDIPSISTISAYYVLNTVSTFRYTPATDEELLESLRSIKEEGLPYLVATEGSSGMVLGYCYATGFRPSKRGYLHTVEISIYCDPGHVSKGIGGLLLKELLSILRLPQNRSEGESNGPDVRRVKNVIASMAVDESGPENGLALRRFYERFGFEQVGHLKGVGYKFERWYVCEFKSDVSFA